MLFHSTPNVSESSAVYLIADVLGKNEETGLQFFDALLAAFETFDEHNRNAPGDKFSNEIEYIIECAIYSIKHGKYPDRADSFFYVYQRIQEYVKIINSSSYGKSIDNLKKCLLFETRRLFSSSNGLEPNMLIQDKILLKRIKIQQFISPLTVDDENTLELFLALAKLFFQASMCINEEKEQNRSMWAFVHFPFDVQAYIHTLSLSKQKIAFEAIFDFAEQLQLNNSDLWQGFLPLFERVLIYNHYESIEIADFLQHISQYNDLFRHYYSILSNSNLNSNTAWNVFLILGGKGVINDDIRKHTYELVQKNKNIECFNTLMNQAVQYLPRISDETNRTKLTKALEIIFDDHMKKLSRNEGKFTANNKV
ncbi:unnamed protein product [Didymodactylos carnosus]|uniref:Uncharacterized protein n=1 Tax=Didymodactylos carnosus TaxID=1234261 RepID=A0A8S2T082_9BILA|nr:unnamed protein product [Didymodactylos carnosus]CAF4232440.1 unnamed protein product [Didymodactylos carnosus]